MTAAEFRACLDDLSARFDGGPSPVLDHAHEIELQDTAICLQWNEAADRVDLTIPLPAVIDTADDPVQALRLMQLLLEHHWSPPQAPDRVVFAVIADLDEVVATVALDGDDIDGADDLLDQIDDALARALGAWYEACAQVLAQAAVRAAVEDAGRPADRSLAFTIA